MPKVRTHLGFWRWFEKEKGTSDQDDGRDERSDGEHTCEGVETVVGMVC